MGKMDEFLPDREIIDQVISDAILPVVECCEKEFGESLAAELSIWCRDIEVASFFFAGTLQKGSDKSHGSIRVIFRMELRALGWKESTMITIGIVLRGPELEGSDVDRLITAVMKAAMECRGSFYFGSGPAINVVYHVPGSLGAPDWDGIRDAKFSRKRQLLMIQVAVPSELVESPKLKDYLISTLYGANAVAFEFFRQKGLRYPLADAEKLVQQIKERVDSQTASA